MKKTVFITLLIILGASQLFAYTEGKWMREVRKITGQLSKEEKELAEFSKDIILLSWDETLDTITSDEFDELVRRCAYSAKSSKMKKLMKMGKAGEKALKALIVLTEDLADNLEEIIDDKADEYDKRHK